MAATRTISADKKTITVEFNDGSMFGPIENNSTNDALTKMIVVLDGRLAKLESKARF